MWKALADCVFNSADPQAPLRSTPSNGSETVSGSFPEDGSPQPGKAEGLPCWFACSQPLLLVNAVGPARPSAPRTGC